MPPLPNPPRAWQRMLGVLPPIQGQHILDLGCGAGEQAAQLSARGASVTGLDMNAALIQQAQSKQIPNARFVQADLRSPLPFQTLFDGLWCSFTAAYFPTFAPILQNWRKVLKPGAWAAFLEIDNLFGHEPLSPSTRAQFEAYARDALVSGRYDFCMGHKLAAYVEQSGFSILQTFTLGDPELAFDGPASPEILEAWQGRFERMKLFQDFCGASYKQLHDEFLHCLCGEEHRSIAKVYGVLVAWRHTP